MAPAPGVLFAPPARARGAQLSVPAVPPLPGQLGVEVEPWTPDDGQPLAAGLRPRRNTADNLSAYLNDVPVMCGNCLLEVKISCSFCAECKAPPELVIGGWHFVGETKGIYESGGVGPALANSCVRFGRARSSPSGGVSPCGGKPRELLVAAKTIPLDGEPEDVEMARREIEVCKAFHEAHPNLLPLLFGEATATELVLLSPYAPGGDLHRLTYIGAGVWKCIEEADAGFLASQLLSGLATLHDAGFLHGDIKPHNVFLTNVRGAYVAQIGDFGLTRRMLPNGVPSIGGTSGYMAPEMVGRVAGSPPPLVSYAADLFALGVMMYQLLSSIGPFSPASNVRAPLEFDRMCWEPLADEAMDFVGTLLSKAPEDRGTAEAALAHLWLRVAPDRPRGMDRARAAPKPETDIRFHRVAALHRRGSRSPGPGEGTGSPTASQ